MQMVSEKSHGNKNKTPENYILASGTKSSICKLILDFDWLF